MVRILPAIAYSRPLVLILLYCYMTVLDIEGKSDQTSTQVCHLPEVLLPDSQPQIM